MKQMIIIWRKRSLVMEIGQWRTHFSVSSHFSLLIAAAMQSIIEYETNCKNQER